MDGWITEPVGALSALCFHYDFDSEFAFFQRAHKFLLLFNALCCVE